MCRPEHCTLSSVFHGNLELYCCKASSSSPGSCSKRALLEKLSDRELVEIRLSITEDCGAGFRLANQTAGVSMLDAVKSNGVASNIVVNRLEMNKNITEADSVSGLVLTAADISQSEISTGVLVLAGVSDSCHVTG